MANLSVPYLVRKAGARGALPRYFWQPATWLRAEGFATVRVPADWASFTDPGALEAAAIGAARTLNADMAAARAAAKAGQVAAPAPALRTLADLLAAYQASREYAALRPVTRAGYAKLFPVILDWGGTVPVRAITTQRVMGLVRSLEDTPARAAHVAAVLRLVLEWGRRNGWLAVNPAVRLGLDGGQVGGPIWPAEAVAAFVATADAMGWHSIGTAVMLNEWLGQREGDVLRLSRPTLRNGTLWVRQGKRNAVAALPVGMVPHLVERLEQEAARQAARGALPATFLVSETTGRPWAEDAFRKRFAEIRAHVAAAHPAGFVVDYLMPGRDPAAPDAFVVHMADLTFMRLRHTAVTRLAEAGCDLPHIATVTGHAESTVAEVIRHYMVRTATMARVAFGKRLAARAPAGGAAVAA